MSIFYSANTGGFYDSSIHGDNLPSDAVEISKSHHQSLLAGHSNGKQIVSDADGYPLLADPAPVPISDLAKRQRTAIENARKAAEADGVTVNTIRYAGDPGNRAALREALDFADTQGLTTFASWKDSDDVFHANHPVADVRQALNDIAARRSQLIAREGELVAEINAAEQAEDREALEAIEWSFTES